PISSRIVSSEVFSIRTCVWAVVTLEPSSLSNSRGPTSAPSSPIMARTTSSSRRVKPVSRCPPRLRGSGRRRASKTDIVDARNGGKQRDHDRTDHDADHQNSGRFKQRHHPFNPVAPLLLGESRGRSQHFREPSGPLPDPNEVNEDLIENAVILQCRRQRIAAPHCPLHLDETPFETLDLKRVARQGQALHKRDPVLQECGQHGGPAPRLGLQKESSQ